MLHIDLRKWADILVRHQRTVPSYPPLIAPTFSSTCLTHAHVWPSGCGSTQRQHFGEDGEAPGCSAIWESDRATRDKACPCSAVGIMKTGFSCNFALHSVRRASLLCSCLVWSGYPVPSPSFRSLPIRARSLPFPSLPFSPPLSSPLSCVCGCLSFGVCVCGGGGGGGSPSLTLSLHYWLTCFPHHLSVAGPWAVRQPALMHRARLGLPEAHGGGPGHEHAHVG